MAMPGRRVCGLISAAASGTLEPAGGVFDHAVEFQQPQCGEYILYGWCRRIIVHQRLMEVFESHGLVAECVQDALL